MSTVFVFGAGASAAAGAPLMNNFVDHAARLIASNKCGGDRASFDTLLRLRESIQIIHSKTQIEIHNIETLMSLLDLEEICTTNNVCDTKDLNSTIDHCVKAIARTLEQSVLFYKESMDSLVGPEPYRTLVRLCYPENDNTGRIRRFSFITFNYDVGLEMALANRSIKVNYFDDIASGKGVKVMKPHGSINWSICDCGVNAHNIEVNTNIATKLSGGSHIAPVILDSSAAKCDKCSSPRRILITPPTWNKSKQYNVDTLKAVWKSAAISLKNCDNIVVCGYSLPPTDQFFSFLFGLSTIGKIKNKIIVVDPDPNVLDRYEAMLGPGLKNRFERIQKKFEHSWEDLKKFVSL